MIVYYSIGYIYNNLFYQLWRKVVWFNFPLLKQFYFFLSNIDAFCLFVLLNRLISPVKCWIKVARLSILILFQILKEIHLAFPQYVSCRFFRQSLYQVDIFCSEMYFLWYYYIHFNFFFVSLRILYLFHPLPFNKYLCLYLKYIFGNQNIIGSDFL